MRRRYAFSQVLQTDRCSSSTLQLRAAGDTVMKNHAPKQLRRIAVVYNTDYDAELKEATGADVSAVRESSLAIRQAAEDWGIEATLIGVEGPDLGELIGRLQADRPDLVFNLCESMSGSTRNEAAFPAVLDTLAIPYTGPGPMCLALCLHKHRAKQVLQSEGVATPPFFLVRRPADLNAPFIDELSFPYFLKLSREDASVGIDDTNVAHNAEALRARAAEMLSEYRQPVVAEGYIEGREFNVTVVGPNADLSVLPLQEIDFSAMPHDRPHVVTYAAKWDEDHVDYAGTKPVRSAVTSGQLRDALERVSLAGFRAVGMCDFGRVDLRVDEAGNPWIIDLNPNPDLSPDAGVARTAADAGFTYPQFIGHICTLAWNRYVNHDQESAS